MSKRRHPPARWSSRLYVRIDPSLVHMFRFHLEAQDNLGLMSVADRWACVLQILFSPHQEKEMRAFLADLGTVMPLRVLEAPLEARWPAQQARGADQDCSQE